MWNEAWREEHRAGPTGPAAGHPAAITPNGHRCVELIVFIKSESTSAQRNKNLRGTLYKSLMSDGIVHTKCMQAVNYLSCFLFPLTGVRCGLKNMKNEKTWGWLVQAQFPSKRCSSLCWAQRVTLALLTDHSLTINRYSCGQMFRQRHHSQN